MPATGSSSGCRGSAQVLAAVIIAEIGDVTRFPTAAQLSARAGLTPKHRESDTSVTRGHVTEQGLQAAAVGADRGDPARPRRLMARRCRCDCHRPARQAGPQHREGRRRPPAADWPATGCATARSAACPNQPQPRERAPGQPGTRLPPSLSPAPARRGRRSDWPRPALTADATCPMPPSPPPGPAKG